MNWRRLLLLLAFLASCGRAYAQPTGSTPPNPCLNVLTCAQTRVHSKRRIYIEPNTTTGTGTVTTSNTTINCGTTACDFRGVEPGDQITINGQSRLVNTVATSACPVTGSNANCRVIIRDPGLIPDETNATWTYKKAALYVPHGTDSTQQIFIVSPDQGVYAGQPASCSTPPCSPHAFFGATQPNVPSHATVARNANQGFRFVGGDGGGLTTDTGGTAGTGAASTQGGGGGGAGVGSDTGGTGGSFSLNGGAGGAITNATDPAGFGGGTGGALTITAGPGGAISNRSSGTPTAGRGGATNIAAGAGGSAPASSVNGNGGDVSINAGAAGGGAGTAGTDGAIRLGNTTGNVLIGTTTDRGTKVYLNGQIGMVEAAAFGAVTAADGIWGVENRTPNRGYFKNDVNQQWPIGYATWTGATVALVLAADNTTRYFYVSTQQNNAGTSAGVTESNFDIAAPGALGLHAMACAVSVAPNNGAGTQTRTFTFREAAAGTTATCTISETATACTWCVASSGTPCSTTSASPEAVASGATIDIEAAAANTPAAADATCTIWWTLDAF